MEARGGAVEMGIWLCFDKQGYIGGSAVGDNTGALWKGGGGVRGSSVTLSFCPRKADPPGAKG